MTGFFTNLCKLLHQELTDVLIFVIMAVMNTGRVFAKYVYAILKTHANAERAAPMERYMRNQFRFFGIPGPLRRQLLKSFLNEWRSLPMPAAWVALQWLWSQEERECQYMAMELIQRRHKEFRPDDLPFIEALITTNSWWDTVDFIAANLAGPYFLRFTAQTDSATARWNQSDHLWLRRSSIIFQLKYKEKTRQDLLFGYCSNCAADRDFFIRKAIGWALRQFAKTEPETVGRFLDMHELSALSVKEARKSMI